MAGERFHGKAADKRRGGNLPARLRFTARRGVTLIELMIAMLILAIVCVSWLEIIGIQSAKREARRREAVERLAGMMDAFMYINRGSNVKDIGDGYYFWNENTLEFIPKGEQADAYPVFRDDENAVGYRLHVVDTAGLFGGALFDGWDAFAKKQDNLSRWLVGELFKRVGTKDEIETAFFTLPVCLGSSIVDKK